MTHIAVRRFINLINWKLIPLCENSKEGDIGYELGWKRAKCKPCHKIARENKMEEPRS